MSKIAGTLITRNYTNFRGVDFSSRKDEISMYRSPDALNMWKNYKNNGGRCIETRPDVELLGEYSDTIYGLFFYDNKLIVHSGNKLYSNNVVIFENMNRLKSCFFIYGKTLYIKDGKNYLQYNGIEIKEVEGYIPTTTISRSPSGGGTKKEDVNFLTGIRRNSFYSDGTSTEYFLDCQNIDRDYDIKVVVNDEIVNNYSVDYTDGKIIFNTAPLSIGTIGKDNVFITFRKTIEGYRERIDKCTLLEMFDNRVFFSGNPDYPNVVWHCSLNDPTYCSDLDYYEEGTADSPIKSLIAGNNALWVLKEPSQTNTNIFYHNPTIDSDYGKIYPSTHSSISLGCTSSGINFNDSIVFFSDRGLERISGDVTTEQVVSHASSLVDNSLLNEEKYRSLLLSEWEGYLLAVMGGNIYLANSREMTTINDHVEYEWYYWELGKKVTSIIVKDGILYLGCEEQEKIKGTKEYLTKYKIYTLTNNKPERIVKSYWTTLEDEFKYPHYRKTTNKKGCTIDLEGNSVNIYVKADNNPFVFINEFKNVKGYVVPKIKLKKWKSIQLKFESNKPFQLYSSTLESYVGSYVKR